MILLSKISYILKFASDHIPDILLVFIFLFVIYLWMTRKKDYKCPPGPIWQIPGLGYLPFLRHKAHMKIAKLKEKYGDIIGLNLGFHYAVFLNEYNLVKEVLNHPEALGRSQSVVRNLPLGIDFKQKIVNLDGMPIKLQIWDTAGQERFRTLTTAYYRGAMGILLMYDVTNMDSFNHLSYWFRNVEENASPDVVKVLAGNKCDSSNLRVVDYEQGKKIADSCDVPFFECSCKEDTNINDIFLTLARLIREQRERRASKFDEMERLQWDKAQLTYNQQSSAGIYKCSC